VHTACISLPATEASGSRKVKSEWQIADVPDLQIIPQTLFDAAQNKIERKRTAKLSRQRQPHHILPVFSGADLLRRVCQQAGEKNRAVSAF
jgi:hypothetical protein